VALDVLSVWGLLSFRAFLIYLALGVDLVKLFPLKSPNTQNRMTSNAMDNPIRPLYWLLKWDHGFKLFVTPDNSSCCCSSQLSDCCQDLLFMWCCRGYIGFVIVVFLFLYLSSPALVVAGP
jgi:hypothetical protein